jgi:cytoskeletal protein RodZ
MLEENETFEGFEIPPEEEQPPEEKGNRTFWIIGGVFAGLIFFSLVCLLIYLLLIRPQAANRTATQVAQQTAVQASSETQVAAQTQTAEASLWTQTPQPTPMPTNTPRPTIAATATSVVVLATPTETPTTAATLQAMQTQLAGQMTQTFVAQSTRSIGGEGPLPTTGFADEVGFPLLVVLTFALLAVIFIARRMRRVAS